MDKNLRNRTLALAAVFQSAAAADQVARTGSLNENALKPLIGSLLARDANNLEDVYGGLANLCPGLEILKDQLKTKHRRPPLEIIRYAISLVHLERRLAKRPEIVERLRTGIANAQRQSDYFGQLHDNVIGSLALLYRETISELGPRIIVRGEEALLSNEGIASLVRVLLLSGIRASVLWRQAGGTRLSLFISRKSIMHEAEHLLTRYAPVY